MTVGIREATSDVLHSLDVAGSEMIGKLGGADGLGFKLLLVLFGIMFFYKVIIFMIDSSQKIMVDVTKLLITFSILASMLAGWTSPINSTVSVSGFFLNTIPAVAEVFTDDKNPTSEIVDLHSNAILELYKVISPDDGKEVSIVNRMINALPGVGFAKKVASGVVNGKGVGEAVVDTAFEPINILISTVILLIAAFFILWSLLTFVFVLNAGQVMLYIGLALGPILIPFLLIPNLSFLFNGWLKFMISAALYKVIAVLVGMLAIGTVKQIVVYASGAGHEGESLIFMSLMVLFFSMLAKQLMGLADNMASSLATGGANSGGTGDSGSVVMMTTKTGGSATHSSPQAEVAKPAPKAKS